MRTCTGMPHIPHMSTTDIQNIVCTAGVGMNSLRPGIHQVMSKCMVLAQILSQVTVAAQQGIISTIIILRMNSGQVQHMPTCHLLMLNIVGSELQQQLPGGLKAQPILSSHIITGINEPQL